MEIQDGYIGYRYARQKYNANWYNANLDTKLRIDECAINDTINHLQDCKKNPTVGLLLREKYKTSNYPECFKRNLRELYCNKQVKKVNDDFISTYYKLYPKTGKIRKYLIKSKSIVFDSINPIKKGLERTLFKFLMKFI